MSLRVGAPPTADCVGLAEAAEWRTCVARPAMSKVDWDDAIGVVIARTSIGTGTAPADGYVAAMGEDVEAIGIGTTTGGGGAEEAPMEFPGSGENL